MSFRWLQYLKSFFKKPPRGHIVYSLPNPAVFSKLYNYKTEFQHVNWTQWNDVVDGFQDRFTEWYFRRMPIPDHGSYMDLCTICALIDVFTHYTNPKDWHDQQNYKEFLRKLNPVFRTKIFPPTEITRFRDNRWTNGKLKDYADVFYAGVRCSLHHHGDLACYAGMSGLDGPIAIERPNGGTSQCRNHTFTLVIFDPGALCAVLQNWFNGYCQRLKRYPTSSEALLFKQKLRNDFGVVVP